MHELNGFQERWVFQQLILLRKKCTNALYWQSGGGGGGGYCHFSDYFTSSLNLRHSCTSPVLCWSLGSISIAIAWEKKVLLCYKFCLSIVSIGWLSTVLNHTFLAKSALKQYFHRKKMSQCTLCEKMKAFLPELPEIWLKECRDCYELLVPP